MGRIFEVRKATMFARWDRMAKQFTRIGKEIAIAVKAGGPDPEYQSCSSPLFSECEGCEYAERSCRSSDKKSHGQRDGEL